jgi:hypothetical protein
VSLRLRRLIFAPVRAVVQYPSPRMTGGPHYSRYVSPLVRSET